LFEQFQDSRESCEDFFLVEKSMKKIFKLTLTSHVAFTDGTHKLSDCSQLKPAAHSLGTGSPLKHTKNLKKKPLILQKHQSTS
jgi:hypothetical protein